jgi:hypothetical protein
MCVGAQDVVGVGRVIALSTWKCLGGVHDEQWADWYPHSTNVGKFTRDFIVSSQLGRITRDLSKGTMIYAGFENPPTMEGPARYTAFINDRIIDALTGKSGVQESQWIEDIPMLDLNVL